MARKKKDDSPDSVIDTLGAIQNLAEMPELIHRLAGAIDQLEKQGCSRRLLVLMLHDVSKVSKQGINKVLDALPLLVERFTVPVDSTAKDTK